MSILDTPISFEDTPEGFVIVQKDWTKWKKEHPNTKYGKLLPKEKVQMWNSEAASHKTAYDNHIASAEKLPSGSPERRMHSDAAVSHLKAKEHANGVLEGTHNPEEYKGKNLKSKILSAKANNFTPEPEPSPNSPKKDAGNFSGMFRPQNGMKFASEVTSEAEDKELPDSENGYSHIFKGIPKSTSYKAVHRESGKIIAEGSAKSMRSHVKTKNKEHGAGTHFVGVSNKKVGDSWGSK